MNILKMWPKEWITCDRLQKVFRVISSNFGLWPWTWPHDLELELSRSIGQKFILTLNLQCGLICSKFLAIYVVNPVFTGDHDPIDQGHGSKWPKIGLKSRRLERKKPFFCAKWTFWYCDPQGRHPRGITHGSRVLLHHPTNLHGKLRSHLWEISVQNENFENVTPRGIIPGVSPQGVASSSYEPTW